MWKCKNCGNTDIVRFTYGDATLMQNKFDEYCIPENEKLYKFTLKKYGNYVCQQCGASSEDLEDIVEWIEKDIK